MKSGGAQRDKRPGDAWIEHTRQREVIKTADWVLDLGSEGGDKGVRLWRRVRRNRWRRSRAPIPAPTGGDFSRRDGARTSSRPGWRRSEVQFRCASERPLNEFAKNLVASHTTHRAYGEVDAT